MIRQLLPRVLLAVIAVVALTGAATAAPPGGHGGFAPHGSFHAPVYHSAVHTYPAFHNYGYHYYPAYRAHSVYHYGYGYRPFYGYAPYSYGYGFYPYSYGSGVYPYSWSYPSVGSYLTTDPGLNSVPADAPPAATGTDPGAAQNPPPAAAPVSAGADATRTAHITVNLPADAVLWFDGIQMTKPGSTREFDTPPVAAGRHYAYQVHAIWMVDNRPMDQTQQVEFAPGDRVAVTFPMAIP